MVKNPPARRHKNCGFTPLGWEDPLEEGEGHGNPLQHSCLENPLDRGAWQVTVYSEDTKESDSIEPCLLTLSTTLVKADFERAKDSSFCGLPFQSLSKYQQLYLADAC